MGHYLAALLSTHELPGELRLVAVGQGLLDGEDDAVGDDGEEDGVLEGRPLDQELGHAPQHVRLAQDEQRRRTLLLLLAVAPLLLRHRAAIAAAAAAGEGGGLDGVRGSRGRACPHRGAAANMAASLGGMCGGTRARGRRPEGERRRLSSAELSFDYL